MEQTNDSQDNNLNQEQKALDNQLHEPEQENINFKNRIDLSELQAGVELIKNEISKVIVGQKEMIDMLIVSILANGHSLIEGVPGVEPVLAREVSAARP